MTVCRGGTVGTSAKKRKGWERFSFDDKLWVGKTVPLGDLTQGIFFFNKNVGSKRRLGTPARFAKATKRSDGLGQMPTHLLFDVRGQVQGRGWVRSSKAQRIGVSVRSDSSDFHPSPIGLIPHLFVPQKSQLTQTATTAFVAQTTAGGFMADSRWLTLSISHLSFVLFGQPGIRIACVLMCRYWILT